MIEKAFAAWPGKSSADNFNEGGQGHRAAGYLTGFVHSSENPTSEGNQKARLINAIEHHSIVTAATKGEAPNDWGHGNSVGEAGEMMIGGIAFGHVYEIVEANEDNVTLRNPWGYYGRVDGKEVEEAESVLSWDEFFSIMSNWSLITEAD